MNVTPPTNQGQTPIVQLLKLGLFVAIGMILTLAVSLVVILMSQGFEIFDNPTLMTKIQFDIPALKILLVLQQILVFLLPALVFARTEGWKATQFYDFKKPEIAQLILVLALMVFAVPTLSLITEWNAHMEFPPFLKGVENWMRDKENDAAETTELVLRMKSIGGLLVNLLVIAATPAVCEELIFRGALQGTFLRLLKNPHVAIWSSAIIFSAIHLQFFGFLPRMLLGAAFGYIYFWTKNLWYTIFAHFLNNAYAVSIAYYLQKNNLPIKEGDEMSIAWYGYVISAILTLALFKVLKDRAETKAEEK